MAATPVGQEKIIADDPAPIEATVLEWCRWLRLSSCDSEENGSKVLALSSCDITDDDIKNHISEALICAGGRLDTGGLIRIDLSNNRIGERGVEFLVKAVQKWYHRIVTTRCPTNCSLECIDLANNKIASSLSSGNLLVEMVYLLPSLKELILDSNPILIASDTVDDDFLHNLRSVFHLRSLTFEEDEFEDHEDGDFSPYDTDELNGENEDNKRIPSAPFSADVDRQANSIARGDDSSRHLSQPFEKQPIPNTDSHIQTGSASTSGESNSQKKSIDFPIWFALVRSNSPELINLNISSLRIGDERIVELCVALRHNTNLKRLDMRANHVTCRGARAIANLLGGSTPHASITLGDSSIAGDHSDFSPSATNLDLRSWKEPSLVCLQLDWNKIGHEGARSIACALPTNGTLEELYIGYNSIGDDGAFEIADALRSQRNRLWTQRYQRSADTKLSPSKSRGGLVELSLVGNGIGTTGSSALSFALAAGSVGTPTPRVSSRSSLWSSLLSLFKTKRRRPSSLPSAPVMTTSPQCLLKRLHLGNNDVGDEGLRPLVDAIEKNITLEFLSLWNCGLTNAGVERLRRRMVESENSRLFVDTESTDDTATSWRNATATGATNKLSSSSLNEETNSTAVRLQTDAGVDRKGTRNVAHQDLRVLPRRTILNRAKSGHFQRQASRAVEHESQSRRQKLKPSASMPSLGRNRRLRRGLNRTNSVETDNESNSLHGEDEGNDNDDEIQQGRDVLQRALATTTNGARCWSSGSNLSKFHMLLPSEPSEQIPLAYLKHCTGNFEEQNEVHGMYGDIFLGHDAVMGRRFLVQKLRIDLETNGVNLDSVVLRKTDFLVREIAAVKYLNHPNVATLYAYAVPQHSSDAFCLVYGMGGNGTLEHFLRSANGRLELSWERRVGIALNVAAALHYLHHGAPSRNRGVHRDVRPSNIFLTLELSAQLMDCGLARMFRKDNDTGNTIFRATRRAIRRSGYACPMYAAGLTNGYEKACDIFSLGIVMTELATGMLQHSPHMDQDGNQYQGVNLFTRYGGREPKKDLRDEVDEMAASTALIPALEAFCQLALECIRMDPAARPSSGQVLARLRWISSMQREAVVGSVHKEEMEIDVEDQSTDTMLELSTDDADERIMNEVMTNDDMDGDWCGW